ncbi:MAG: glycosyltransferase family 4 protein [Bacteroidales bacterium]|nr:glycosyltransferase family 4 protein [Bacteroidales bacterium]
MSLFACLLVFVVLLLLELGYFKLADRFNIIDKPNQRSSHMRITLRGGGIVFYFGLLLYFIWSGFAQPWFFAGASLIAAISFADDIKPQSSKLRLLVHFTAMGFMFYQWGLFAMPWYYAVLALIFCTGILNAYNFMDGINGITGGYSSVLLVALWYINQFQVAFADEALLVVLFLAVMVFNLFNFRKKAKCFAGDVGAITMAFVLVYLLGQLIVVTQDLSYILLLAVYGVDSIMTIVHRLRLGENIFEPHRKHLYQILANELKWPHVGVSALYAVLQVLISFGLILLPLDVRLWYGLVVLVALTFVYWGFMGRYFGLHKG